MKSVLIPVAHGFEEIETVTLVDILRRAGVEVILAGITPGPLTGSRKTVIVPDALLEDVLNRSFDMVVLPGGQPGVDHLRADSRVLDLLRRRHAAGERLAAICAAPLAWRDAGITSGIRLTSHPSVAGDLGEKEYLEDRLVEDGHLLTSRGPGTALEFSLKIVEILVGKAKADEIAGQVLLAR